MTVADQPPLRVAEFFAGIGLVRLALEREGFEVVWANDIEPTKQALYDANFESGHFLLSDVRSVRGGDLPSVELATASFPCTDLSLAGNRAGLAGEQSGMFWEFARVLGEMGERRPSYVLLENVPSFATSHGGQDLAVAIERLNALGYACDMLVVDARRFVPQSRLRLFIIGTPFDQQASDEFTPSELRPAWMTAFVAGNLHLALSARALSIGPRLATSLSDVVERLPRNDKRWWEPARVERFVEGMADLHMSRLRHLRSQPELTWATAYRRTRSGRPVWEIRSDQISGCLRTPRGGSSKQALVEAGRGKLRVRWMTPREYARLQGVPDSYSLGEVTDSQALFGFGDAVCVPVVQWVATCLLPLIRARQQEAADPMAQIG